MGPSARDIALEKKRADKKKNLEADRKRKRDEQRLKQQRLEKERERQRELAEKKRQREQARELKEKERQRELAEKKRQREQTRELKEKERQRELAEKKRQREQARELKEKERQRELAEKKRQEQAARELKEKERQRELAEKKRQEQEARELKEKELQRELEEKERQRAERQQTRAKLRDAQKAVEKYDENTKVSEARKKEKLKKQEADALAAQVLEKDKLDKYINAIIKEVLDEFNWGMQKKGLRVYYELVLSESGHVVDIKLTQSSGNSVYDKSVVNAIILASPLMEDDFPDAAFFRRTFGKGVNIKFEF